MVFRFADSTEIKAHKIILAAHSAVFGAMFEPHTKESTEGIVTVSEEKDVFKTMLKFVYSGQVTFIENKIWSEEDVALAKKVLVAADKVCPFYPLPSSPR